MGETFKTGVTEIGREEGTVIDLECLAPLKILNLPYGRLLNDCQHPDIFYQGDACSRIIEHNNSKAAAKIVFCLPQ